MIVFTVEFIDLHRVNILRTGGTDPDHLAVKALYQRGILRFRITDNDIIICHEVGIGDLPFCREGLAGSRRAENQAVRVL